MRGNKHPFSALIACFAILGMVAGGAVAFPAKFHSIVSSASHVFHRGATRGTDAAAGHGSSAPRGQVTHAPDECQSVVDGILADPPATQDVRGLQRAIEAVEANCQRNADAKGLLQALSHLVANAQRQVQHSSHAGGNGDGHGPGGVTGTQGHAGGNGRGDAHGHAGA